MLNRLHIAVAIFVVCTVLALTDFFVNNYESELAINNIQQNLSASVLQNTPNRVEVISDTFLQRAGLNDLTLSASQKSNKLFEVIKIPDDIYMTKRSVRKENKTALRTYEITKTEEKQQSLSIYQTLKIQAQELSKNYPHIQINETNSFGEASFYMNDEKRKNIAFLVFKLGDRVFCIEYHKANGEVAEKIVNALAIRQ